jgi:hypothetical protein
MTDSHQSDRREATPDEPLNPEPIAPLPAAIIHQSRRARRPKGRFRELSWALAALLPFAVALVAHGAIAGWSVSTIDPSNLGYSLFALALASIVRIVSHGSGKDLLPLLLGFGVLQIALALYYAGTFNSSTPSKEAIDNASKTIAASSAPTASRLHKISELLATVVADDHEPSITAYICLFATGIMSAVVLVRYWSPAISEQTEES